MPTEPPEYLLIEEASELSRTPVQTLYQWRRRRIGPPVRKVGRKLLYKRSELVAWIDAQTDNRAA